MIPIFSAVGIFANDLTINFFEDLECTQLLNSTLVNLTLAEVYLTNFQSFNLN